MKPILFHEQASEIPLVISIPHSGLLIPPAVTFKNPNLCIEIDWYLDQLYEFIQHIPVSTIIQPINRYIIDVNRPLPAFHGHSHSLIPVNNAKGQQLYPTYPGKKKIQERIQSYYQPYHRCLQEQLERLLKKHESVYLFDLHSFFQKEGQGTLIIGNHFGKSCQPMTNQLIQESFSSYFQLEWNIPYAGGYITRHYGKHPRIEALQLEISQQTYIQKDLEPYQYQPQIQSNLFNQTQLALSQAFESFLNKNERN